MARCMSLVLVSMERTSSSTLRFGMRLKIICRLYVIWLFTGSFLAKTASRYARLRSSGYSTFGV